MNNKKGFISTSLIYAFFIIFVVILLALLGLYANNRILLNRVKSEIKGNINLNEMRLKRLYDEIITQEIDTFTIEAKGNPNMAAVPTASTSGLYVTADEYGKSFYYRGIKESLRNNVIFAEHQWKIVRINGDGSIRLIYNGICPNNSCSINSIGTATAINNGAIYAWNITNTNDAKYSGYMYGGANGSASTDLSQAQKNETSSNAKEVLDSWYENNIKDTKYEAYIVDNIFCNDRSTTSGLGYGENETYYKAHTRLQSNATNPTPTLKCEKKTDRFTVSNTTVGNGALIYPIGLITADEAQYAGTGQIIYNTNQYLYTGQSFWTYSPYMFSTSISFMWIVGMPGLLYSGNVTQEGSLRAVLNLSSKVLVSKGDGTISNPYIIKTN